MRKANALPADSESALTNLQPRATPARTGVVRRLRRLIDDDRRTGAPAAARTFFTPRWILLHVFVGAIVVTMVLLGRWQLDVSNTKHFNLQNFGYALQWWAFSAFALFLWWRIVRDVRRPRTRPSGESRVMLAPGQGQVAGQPFVGPADLVAWTDDPEHAPVLYRGYVAPQSATSPAHSEGDMYHASYNDYLWQLAMADAAKAKSAPSLNPPTPPEIEADD